MTQLTRNADISPSRTAKETDFVVALPNKATNDAGQRQAVNSTNSSAGIRSAVNPGPSVSTR